MAMLCFEWLIDIHGTFCIVTDDISVCRCICYYMPHSPNAWITWDVPINCLLFPAHRPILEIRSTVKIPPRQNPLGKKSLLGLIYRTKFPCYGKLELCSWRFCLGDFVWGLICPGFHTLWRFRHVSDCVWLWLHYHTLTRCVRVL